METTKSIKIIEEMMRESRKSLHRYSVYFIIWGAVMGIAGLVEFFLIGLIDTAWIVWPIAGGIGGALVALSQRKNDFRVETVFDRIMKYVWISFGICLLFVIIYSVKSLMPPHALILLLAANATFISAAITKNKALFVGGIILVVTAIISGFFIEGKWVSLVYAIGMMGGYFIPGLYTKKNEKA
ncbi:hypothetical protein [Psychroflexus halocasei]|uniref:Uncharacterized protein n=1 Tax=Psychroflexus halocasei TaxID=908615 RepID=A0A1H4BV87_9FLAO|nr:hypothetical protein [Psychroflexus halocasei]SEA51993.1 hypothetical protein SAMN05421540_106173 [Psychroflexus halocasei]